MSDNTLAKDSWSDNIASLFYRFAATGAVPASWFLKTIPATRAAKKGLLNLEVVSHCWQYSHLLIYQLSSFINYPPTRLKVRVTIYANEEDTKTLALLRFIQSYKIENVEWNWQFLPKEKLFRRAIGRNLAAKNTSADWVWFTDCDTVFHQGCLDNLAEQLQGRSDILVYPKRELTTDLLAD